MEEKTQNKDLLKMARRYGSKKNLLSISSMLLVVAIGIASAFPGFIVSPDKLQTTKFWTDLIVNIIIGLTSFACMMVVGQSTNASNQASNIFIARGRFGKVANDVLTTKLRKFSQWIKLKFHPEQQKEKDIELLRGVGITNVKYLELDIEELKDLITTPRKDLKRISEEQFKVFRYIKSGKSAIKFANVNAYVTERNYITSKTSAEIVAGQNKARVMNVASLTGARLVLMVGISIIFSLIGWKTVEEISGGARTASIVINIIMRIFTAISNAMIGFNDGARLNDIDAEYLDEKRIILNHFLEDKEFKELSEEEEAKEEFIAFVKEKEKENSKQLGIWNGDGKQEVAIINQK